VQVITEGPAWNYTSFLNVIFLGIAAMLVTHFPRTGGPAMPRMMGTPEEAMEHHTHDGSDEPAITR